jgi:hypothetical protein
MCAHAWHVTTCPPRFLFERAQEWLATEGLSAFAKPLDQFGVDSVAALAASTHDDVYLRFNVGLEEQPLLAKFKHLRELAKQAVQDEAASEPQTHAARATGSNRRASVGEASAAAHQRGNRPLEPEEAEQQLEAWEVESVKSLAEQRQREAAILADAERRRSPAADLHSNGESGDCSSSRSSRGRSSEAQRAPLTALQEAQAVERQAAERVASRAQPSVLAAPKGESRRVSWTGDAAGSSPDTSISSSSSDAGGSLAEPRRRLVTAKSASFGNMEDARALQEWLAGAGLAGFEAALAQFGVASVQDLAESNHDDVYLRFNVRFARARAQSTLF